MDFLPGSSQPQTIRVTLSPTPGWCIKTTALQTAVCKVSSSETSQSSDASSAANSSILEPSAKARVPSSLTIPQGTKVFVNIAWDSNVPPPPEGSEDVIQRAMKGEEEFLDSDNPGWFVPVVVSEPRQDADKAGKPSVVFDSVFHSSLKSRALKDVEFKTFLEELAFQRIEAQSQLPLSRTVGRPNIRSKGKLNPRTVLIPVGLYPRDHPERVEFEKKLKSRGPLVQEVTNSKTIKKKEEAAKPKGILKTPTEVKPITEKSKISLIPEENEQPAFTWSQEDDHIVLNIEVPRLSHAHIASSTLDVEPHRLILAIPPFYLLDLNIDMPDAQMPVVFGERAGEVSRLKRVVKERKEGFDVESAKAEWRVAERSVVVML